MLQSTARSLLRSASIEVMPGDQHGIESMRALLPRGTRVYIADAGRRSHTEILATAKRLHDEGFVPVPHIAARRFRTRSQLQALMEGLAPLTKEALLIGGDLSDPAGPFDSVLAVLRSGAIGWHNLDRIGLAGYPEGHPAIGDDVLKRSLLDKIDAARRMGLDTYVVTQFCFDASAILAWERLTRRLTDGEIEMHVGMPGVTALGKLLRFATLCGTGASIRFLRKHAYHVAQLMKAWTPDSLALDLCRGVAADPGCRITQLHIFPFGGIDASLRWLKAAQNGALDAALPDAAG